MGEPLARIRQLIADPADRQAIISAANAWRSSTLSWVSRGTRLMADLTLETIRQIEAEQTTVSIPRPVDKALIGLCGRNARLWEQADYDLVKAARIEMLKMMSETDPGVFRRLREENPGIQFITRLHSDQFGVNHHPTPQEFADRMTPIIGALRPYCVDFQIHNEPGHPEGYEGWWLSDEDAMDFKHWFLMTFNILKSRHPWAQFGFPGLAVNHRDLEWLHICKQAAINADWVGVHSYWEFDNINTQNWGRRYEIYREIIPNKIFHILEAGNAQKNLDENVYAQQVVEFYQMCRGRDYIGSVSFFIMSSPDPTWKRFCWRDESGDINGFKPVVAAVGEMVR